MDEYIGRQEAKEWIAAWLREDKYWHPYSKGKNIPTADVFDTLSLIPAADVQPVKHGKNIATEYDGVDQFVCSECGIELQNWVRVERDEDDGDETHHEYRFNFCPNCGTDMRGE